MITSKQANDHGELALRRGHDEILFHRRIEGQEKAATLQRWSISGKSLLSSVPAPNPLWDDGTKWGWGPFRVATSDGNVLYSQTRAGTRDDLSMTAWFESSPDGRVLGQGSMSTKQEDIAASSWFPTSNGGGGLILNVSNTNEPGVNSVVETPIEHDLGGRKIHAAVSREKRLLVINDNAASAWESAAIERDIMWGGDLSIPNDLPLQERLAQSQQYRELMDMVAIEYGANRSVETLNVGPHRLEMIKPMANGFGILSEVTANRDLEPPIHGPYFLTVNESGVHKHAYLEPYAKQLSVKFTMLDVSANDDVYLYGFPNGREDGAYAVLLDADGKPKAYGRTSQGSTIVMEGMAGYHSGVWLFGHAYRNKERARLWVERIEFP